METSLKSTVIKLDMPKRQRRRTKWQPWAMKTLIKKSKKKSIRIK